MPGHTGGGGGRRRAVRKAQLALLAVSALTMSACGLRVGSGQVRAALQASEGQGSGSGLSGVSGGGGTGTSGGGVQAAGTGSTGGGLSGGTTGGGSGGSGLTGAGGGSTGGSPGTSGATATTLPAGGNGGPTDVGVTGNSITVGNVSDLGGPVPGLFQGGPDGTQAYFNYINQTQGGVFGRQLKLVASDDGLQCNQNEADYQNLVNTVFAFVGSWSLDDNCGAQIMAQHTDIPMVQQTLNPQMAALPDAYGISPFAYGGPTGPYVYYKSKFPDAVKAVGTLVGNQPAAVAAWKGIRDDMVAQGYKIVYEDDFPPAQSNFTADVVRMRSNSPPVKEVFLQAVNAPDAADFANEAAQQNWKPQFWDCPVCYFGGYISQSGGPSSVEGQYLSVVQELFLGEDSNIPEVALFDKWLKQGYPDFVPDQFADTSWASAALFVQALKTAGPHLTRKAVLAALAGLHSYSDNGMFPDTDVGGKVPGHCYMLLEIKGGKYTKIDDPPAGFRCDGTFFHSNE